jgi:thiol:disulfide interchange protein
MSAHRNHRFALCLALLLAAGCEQSAAKSAATGVDIIEAPPGDVAATVRVESAAAEMLGRDLLVYVTASWCEPCQRFHRAVRAGQLDARFPRLRLLEFDADRDDADLRKAGYKSRYLPLFARPGTDGRASSRLVEGAPKGGTVSEMASHLEPLLK